MFKAVNVAIFSLAVMLMLLFGLTGVWIGGSSVPQFAYLPARYIAYYSISLLAGLGLLVFGALSLRQAWRRQTILCGLAAGGVLVLNQFLGLRFQAILCFTST